MKVLYIFPVIIAGLLSGCGAISEVEKKNNEAEKMKKIEYFRSLEQNLKSSNQNLQGSKNIEAQYLQDAKQYGFNYEINTPEYIAYEHVFNTIYRKSDGIIKDIDDKLKEKWAVELYNSMEVVYKYKYFETSYNLFDEYKSLDEIKQMSNDNLVLSYIKAEIFRNYLLPPAIKMDIKPKSVSNVKKEITIAVDLFAPWGDGWTKLEKKVVLERQNEKWKIIDSEIISSIENSVSKQVINCKKQDAKYTKDYEKIIERMNKNICSNLARTANKNNGINGPLKSMMNSQTVITRNFTFGSNNGDCMDLYNQKDFDEAKVDELILPINMCSEEISKYIQKGPTDKGMQDFYFNNGSLLCSKDGDAKKVVVSKKNGWIDWGPTKEFINVDDASKRFKFEECSDMEK